MASSRLAGDQGGSSTSCSEVIFGNCGGYFIFVSLHLSDVILSPPQRAKDPEEASATMPRGYPADDQYYWTYMMASLSGTIYIGMTNDIFRRVMKHKEALIDGFAKQYGCNRLVWFETYSEVLWSIRREKQLKVWTR